MARVFDGGAGTAARVFGPAERAIHRVCGIDPAREMGWREYAVSLIIFNSIGALLVYFITRLQGLLPLNPRGLSAPSPDLSFNVAVSFVTNTNWQSYGGESTMSYFTQMTALAVQNFLSAGTGIAVAVALARGLSREKSASIGNFWNDLVKSVLYILLPLSAVLAVVLVWQGVVQNFDDYKSATPLDAGAASRQVLPMGPAAAQIAIKQLGTNGGGYFNVNSAHPFENPTPVSNFLEMLSILLIPAAFCYTFGALVRDKRQGWAILAAMFLLFIFPALLCWWSEQNVNAHLSKCGVATDAGPLSCGGNMEGKEVRFGIVNSTLWAAATTAASNGSVNSMHDSFTPLGGLVPMWMMMLGEVAFGGVGSGLYGMFIFILVAVFLAGLMVGRTPDYLEKEIGPFEMKMAAIVILVPAMLVLVGTAISCVAPDGLAAISNPRPGAHGFSQILYAFTSAANNNGSAFGGVSANTPYYNYALGICMFFGRFAVIVPVLAIAGSLAAKKKTPRNSGTVSTHTPLFIILLASTVIIVGALTFFPALALGPIVEHLQLIGAAGK